MRYEQALMCKGDLHDCLWHAAERDALNLFMHYLKKLYQVSDGQIGISNKQRVSLRLPMERGTDLRLRPILSCWIPNSSDSAGLYVGCSETNILASYGVEEWRSFLPNLTKPTSQHSNQWFFGYLDEEGIDALFRGIETIRDASIR